MVGFLLNFHGYILDQNKKTLLDFGDLDIIFKVTAVEKLSAHLTGGGHIVFGVDPVCVGLTHFCLQNILQTNGRGSCQIFMDI